MYESVRVSEFEWRGTMTTQSIPHVDIEGAKYILQVTYYKLS